ncbi:MAG: hypothetical protein WBW48_00040 [Anaerolineae bacterium]
MGFTHEAEAELLSTEDAIQDTARLRALSRQRRQGERVVAVRVSPWTLLEGIDYLEPDELQQAVQRAEKRLAAVGG